MDRMLSTDDIGSESFWSSLRSPYSTGKVKATFLSCWDNNGLLKIEKKKIENIFYKGNAIYIDAPIYEIWWHKSWDPLAGLWAEELLCPVGEWLWRALGLPVSEHWFVFLFHGTTQVNVFCKQITWRKEIRCFPLFCNFPSSIPSGLVLGPRRHNVE